MKKKKKKNVSLSETDQVMVHFMIVAMMTRRCFLGNVIQ